MVAETQAPIDAEEVTIIPEPEAPSPDEVETALVEETETDTPDEVETPVARSITDYSDEELAEDERVKSLIYRREQSARDKAVAQSAAQQFAREQAYAASPALLDDLSKLVAEAPTDAYGRPQITTKDLEPFTGPMLGRGAVTVVGQLASLLTTHAGPEFRLTQQEQTLASAAQVLYQQNPLNAEPLLNAWITAHDRAVLETAESDLRAKIRREDAAEADAKKKVTQAAAAQAARKASTGATPIAGGAATNGSITVADLDAMSSEDFKLRFPTTEDQQRAINEARQNAANAR